MGSGTALSSAAFEQLYETYWARVFAFVYGRVDSAELAKDLTAEVFERAYLKGRHLRKRAAYAAWLFAIAKNVVANHYRHCQKESNLMDRMKDSLQFGGRSQSPEDRLIQGERLARLTRHVRLLPRRDQEVLSLKFDAELTNGEIAQLMGMTAGNIRITVFRAIRRLREYIVSETQDAPTYNRAASLGRKDRPGAVLSTTEAARRELPTGLVPQGTAARPGLSFS